MNRMGWPVPASSYQMRAPLAWAWGMGRFLRMAWRDPAPDPGACHPLDIPAPAGEAGGDAGTPMMGPRMARDPRSHPLKRLFAQPDFVRLWAVGGLSNAMRWVEILVAGVYIFEVTGSALAVSLLALVRALPMLVFGAVAGALAETLDRRRLLLAGQALSCASTCGILALALGGALQPWHLGVSSFLGGLVWTGEMASRRRMVTEVAGEGDVVPALATDSLTNNTTRMLGPLIGGALYQGLGLAAAYGVAAGCYLVTASLLGGVRHAQVPRRLRPRQLAADVVDAVRVVGRFPALQAVILVTLAMNLFGFSFTAVLPALGAQAFDASPVQIGLLTAAEPAGALLTGLALSTRRGIPLSAPLMVGGCAFFMLCLLVVASAGSLPVAVAVLMVGGIGTALFAALQT
ncbi:MAG: MFS transporter, partial [Acetobacteraceae bacterium]